MENAFPASDKSAELRYAVIGAAMKVHNTLGPGLLESVYETCLCHELTIQGIPFKRQVVCPIIYNGVNTGKVFIADMIIDDQLLIELKAVNRLVPLHTDQTRTYLKLTGIPFGLLINFNTVLLKDGGLVKVELQNSAPSETQKRPTGTI